MALKIEAGRGEFSSFGGLKLFDQVISGCNLRRRVRDLMPTSKRITAGKSYNKFHSMVLGMISGNDCIEDMDHVTQDPTFSALCKEKIYKSPCYGRFLGSFEPWQARKLNESLRDYAFKLRKLAFPKDNNLIIDIDSTSHKQYGYKTEGVAYNYESIRALDSLHVYDQYGFNYHLDVRPGNTFTSNGASHAIRSVFRGAPRRLHRYLRADSGYCNFEVMNACMENKVDFVIAMRANMYEALLQKIDWWKWKPAKTTIARGRRKCEIAVAPYYPKGLKESVRVVIIRAKREDSDIFETQYDHYAWVTNTGEHQLPNEKVIEFYSGRGNAENFIREAKNGMELKNFPCRKLLSNKMYGLIAAFAYNTMRFVAPILNPKSLPFAKRIRFRMVYLGAHVVKKSRYWIIRLNKHHYKEVTDWQIKLQQMLVPS